MKLWGPGNKQPIDPSLSRISTRVDFKIVKTKCCIILKRKVLKKIIQQNKVLKPDRFLLDSS